MFEKEKKRKNRKKFGKKECYEFWMFIGQGFFNISKKKGKKSAFNLGNFFDSLY